MSDSPDSLILNLLRAIRGDIGHIKGDIIEIKKRLGFLKVATRPFPAGWTGWLAMWSGSRCGWTLSMRLPADAVRILRRGHRAAFC